MNFPKVLQNCSNLTELSLRTADPIPVYKMVMDNINDSLKLGTLELGPIDEVTIVKLGRGDIQTTEVLMRSVQYLHLPYLTLIQTGHFTRLSTTSPPSEEDVPLLVSLKDGNYNLEHYNAFMAGLVAQFKVFEGIQGAETHLKFVERDIGPLVDDTITFIQGQQ
ncbi:hypothetical protein BC939DRAFT_503835 [Gamsiella multidivaricata]|uniref:uncharacterized protein n=1 Tax=Gamsiella multidivaricata TaxID=101098 RepID=UPI00221EAD1C|nr:uncharacterized protein BC939DRAFT_503835 [Gamsiella multidivaricata]KAI7822327.1 hypothetical protein BC939DRAFT_503835 [Gamsiella multidivaricata]